MKKLLSVLLATTLLLSLLSVGFSGVSAEENASVMKGTLDQYWNSREVGSTPEENFVDTWDQDWVHATAEKYEVTRTVVNGIGGAYAEKAVKIDCENPNGMYVKGDVYPGRWDVMTNLKTWTKVSGNTNTFMLYVQFPTIDPELQSDVWHRFVELMGIDVCQNDKFYSAGQSDLGNFSFEILSDKAKAWETITVDNNRQNEKLNGFKGYIKIDLKKLNKYSSWVAEGFDPAGDCQISKITYKLPMFGAHMGAFYFGGIYDVTEDNGAVYFQSGDKAPVVMTSYDYNAVKATTINRSQPSNGEPAYNFSVDGTNNNNVTVTASSDKICSIDTGRQAVIIDSKEITGFNVGDKFTNIKMNVNRDLGEGNSDILLYMELPTDPDRDYQAIRSTGIVMADYKYWPSLSSVEKAYSYLENNSNHWVDGNTDSKHEMKLPNGFKGYIRIHIGNTERFKTDMINDDVNLWYWAFAVSKFGGDVGSVKIGGAWLADTSESVNVCLDGENSYRRFNSADQDAMDISDVTGKISSAAVAKLDWADAGTAFASTDEKAISPLGTPVSYSFSAEQGEGQSNAIYDGKYRHAQFNFKFSGVVMDHKTDKLLIYVELPNFKSDGWGLRISGFAFRQNGLKNKYGSDYVFGGAYGNSRYSYLAADGTEWRSAISSGNGELTALPAGFKGYIKIDFNDCMDGDVTKFAWYADTANSSVPFDYNKDYTLVDFNFQCGSYGGDFGAFKVGGFYTVGYDYDNTLLCRLDGGLKTYITTYATDNEQRIDDINSALTELEGETELSKLDKIDQMYSAYESLSKEYKDTVSEEMLAQMAAAKDKYSKYRPAFLGSTVKANNDTDVLSLRIDAQLNTAAAADEGYSVVKYGTVILSNDAFRNDAYFDKSAVGAKVYEKEVSGDTLSEYFWKTAITSNLWNDMGEDVYARSYVVYAKDGSELTVWNSDFTNHKEVKNGPGYTVEEDACTFLRTSFAETATALGVEICAGSLFGDVSGDAKVSAADLASIKQMLLGSEPFTFTYTADVTGDGNVGVQDLIRLKKYTAGLKVAIEPERTKSISAQW